MEKTTHLKTNLCKNQIAGVGGTKESYMEWLEWLLYILIQIKEFCKQ